jgi:hypothetical protein
VRALISSASGLSCQRRCSARRPAPGRRGRAGAGCRWRPRCVTIEKSLEIIQHLDRLVAHVRGQRAPELGGGVVQCGDPGGIAFAHAGDPFIEKSANFGFLFDHDFRKLVVWTSIVYRENTLMNEMPGLAANGLNMPALGFGTFELDAETVAHSAEAPRAGLSAHRYRPDLRQRGRRRPRPSPQSASIARSCF